MTHASKDRTDAPAKRAGRAAAALLLYPLLATGLGLIAGCAGGQEKSAEATCLEEGNRVTHEEGAQEGCPEAPD